MLFPGIPVHGQRVRTLLPCGMCLFCRQGRFLLLSDEELERQPGRSHGLFLRDLTVDSLETAENLRRFGHEPFLEPIEPGGLIGGQKCRPERVFICEAAGDPGCVEHLLSLCDLDDKRLEVGPQVFLGCEPLFQGDQQGLMAFTRLVLPGLVHGG
ncbi:MAG: hypothetical protein BWY66_00085 [bacterium ADurb.Bin374]|nr:MAG: hypothetical protein BWY66_00085 [bacterium ADurb.Bin374]